MIMLWISLFVINVHATCPKYYSQKEFHLLENFFFFFLHLMMGSISVLNKEFKIEINTFFDHTTPWAWQPFLRSLTGGELLPLDLA